MHADAGMGPNRAATRLMGIAPLAVIWACAPGGEPPDPRALPYRLAPVKEYHNPVVAADLTGDGRDELILSYNPNQVEPGRMTALMISSLEGALIDQVNFEGRVQDPHFLDLDGDGRPEILAPVLRSDSLFLNVVGRDGKKRFAFLLTHGEPRVEPEGTLPWDPLVVDFHLVDSDRDGAYDLVTVVNTRYARLPRGILVHRLPDGEPLGEAIVGASIRRSFLRDVDGDGDPEVFVQTAAVHNGAEAGGFDDRRIYLMSFGVVGEVGVEWYRESRPGWGFSHARFADLDGDGSEELLAVTRSDVRGTRLEVLRPGSWEVLARGAIPEPLFSLDLADLDRDARPEIVATVEGERVLMLDGSLKVVNRVPLPGAGLLMVWPDLDRDGVEEIVVGMLGGFALLDADLDLKAVHLWSRAEGGWRRPFMHLLRRGLGASPHLLVRRSRGTLELALRPNRSFLVHRYGMPVAGSLGGVLLLVVGVRLRARTRRSRFLDVVHEALLDRTDSVCLVADSAGALRWMSPRLQNLVEWADGGSSHRTIDELDEVTPGVAAVVRRSLRRASPRPEQGECRLPTEGGGRSRTGAAVEPLVVGDARDPHVLVCLGRSGGETGDRHGVTWGLLSRRVAHDLKNPLTTMLLTVQRMQMEYWERAPELAPDLDGYTGRIENRIEDLRRRASNFVKLVSVEEASPRPVDVNALAEGFAERFAGGLPDDVVLRTSVTPELPLVSADPEQIESVLQNLATNAVNAMPEGGTLTLGTAPASDVQGWDSEAARDFVTIEIMDTGTGIAGDSLDRIFEPGFTTREDGWGLGLAMVRKVVEDHGGHVVVESDLGTGTVVTVLLPADDHE